LEPPLPALPILLALLALPARGAGEPGWSVPLFPAGYYSADQGFTAVLFGAAHYRDGRTEPYRFGLIVDSWISARLIQSHRLTFDLVDPGGLPLRLNAQVGFEATPSANFCGYGAAASCDPAAAEAAAGDLVGDARAEFVEHYHQVRYLKPGVYLNARRRMRDRPFRTELMVGWWGEAHRPGDFQVDEPWPGSLYAQIHPEGERGFLSAAQVGVAVDQRDHEVLTTRGLWAEVSVRVASPALGSDWAYQGANGVLCGYAPLGAGTVLSGRVIADVVFGDAPHAELVRSGGTGRWPAFGGMDTGRGLREAALVGRARWVQQAELRRHLVDFRLWRWDLGLGAVLFADLGFAAERVADVGGAGGRWAAGEGLGLRLRLTEAFLARFDLGFSAFEDWHPRCTMGFGPTW
jgi:hypothetical protein